MTKISQLLSKEECSAMRGIAILAIVLHNFCHWINSPIVKENEFRFRIDRVDGLIAAMGNIDMYLPVQLISFFGHYGVPMFLFLSGWGLVMKYENSTLNTPHSTLHTLSFLRYNYLKLLRIMIIGFAAYIAVDRMTPGAHNYTFSVIVEHLLMVVNFVPDPDHTIHPGPFWFFGIMMQLYVAYIVVFHRFRHWSVVVAAIVVAFAIQLPKAPDSLDLEWTRYNLFGSLLPFGAGLLLARANLSKVMKHVDEPVFWPLALLASLAFVFAMSFFYVSWYLVPIFVCIAAIAFVKLLPAGMQRYAVWLGGISSALFVTHPIARKLFIGISRRGDIYSGILQYVIVAVMIAWIVKMLTDKIPHPKLNTEH